jgi:hypothetical protein
MADFPEVARFVPERYAHMMLGERGVLRFLAVRSIDLAAEAWYCPIAVQTPRIDFAVLTRSCFNSFFVSMLDGPGRGVGSTSLDDRDH